MEYQLNPAGGEPDGERIIDLKLNVPRLYTTSLDSFMEDMERLASHAAMRSLQVAVEVYCAPPTKS